MTFETTGAADRSSGYLDGQFLLAMPGMPDQRFARAVIYICAHSSDGAMGLIVNQPSRKVTFPDLLLQLELVEPNELIRLPAPAETMPVLKGGPVETGRGFVLHSADFFIDNSTLPIDEAVSLTATVDILRAIAKGEGPQKAVLALGYAGWSPGQLEEEIQQNGWLNIPGDPALLFDSDHAAKYGRCLRMIGIDPAMLSGDVGHA